MNKKLYAQATQNVDFEIEDEIKERIQEEYEGLLFESEKKLADEKTLQKIKGLYEESKTIFPRNWGDAYPTHHKKQALEEYAKTGIYNPNKLLLIEKWIKSRIHN
ncbi:MAG: hypothetical protein ABIC91_05330 [Nanoarchaeota archaeon]|nr:hypothetical protein [Nanoarchaeota archaeon]MBU1030454.1 hypothetical protein [Nanoarchaeota archaeon]